MAVLDKIKGIFSGDTETQNSNPNTPKQQEIYEMVSNDYQVFKAARQPMEPIWRQEQRFYMGDHWHGLRPESVSRLRPNSVDNVAWSQIEAIVAKLCGWDPYPDFEPQEPQDDQKATELNEFIPHELKQIKFRSKHVRAVRRMVIHGPLIYKVVYDPTIEGGRGNNRYIGQNDILPVSLDSFYPDPRIRDFNNLQKGQAHIIRTPRPIEYFRERWPGQGDKVTADYQGEDDVFDNDGQSIDSFNRDEYISEDTTTNQQQSTLIEYWYRGVPKMMSREDKELFRELGEEKLASGLDPSEAFAKAEGRMEGVHCIYISTSGVFLEHKSYVYDHGQYPFIARTLFPDEQNPWGKGYMRDMIKPQIMLNKFAEIAIETMAKQGNGAIVYEEGAITRPNTWKEQRSQSGAMLPIAPGRMNDWKELQGVNIPNTVFNMLEYYKDMLQKIPGQFDSARGQANSNVTSGEQAKALISASSTLLNLATSIIEGALEEVFAQYIELIAQFYTTDRIARVVGERIIAMSRDRLISLAESQYEQVDETGQPIEQPVLEEYVPHFDIKVNISVDKPQDREYWIQLAFNLLQMQDPVTGMPMIDMEGVQYTIANGRMEPFDIIRARIEENAGLQQQMMQLQQQNLELTGQLQQMGQALQQQQQANMQGEAEFMRQQREAQKEQFNQEIQRGKLEVEAAKLLR
ncbi:portal protein [Paenibacillus senegalensis]|uniref:portal protein n=1 Tax=Paenibacillus senegalensis TaxID=1465766 RepID=UPI000287E998|nr:hypothetical protein [Paenibacillus senegalensis]